ncbi:EAL domain-containing protein [Planococcus shenhongbingii]|uniref:EAL domain-containing protein n=1 Tax=Planococcus shenhongbingii TaxID=3058398 RepID=UPI002631BF65|nr:EAL domain-containing protein [Planococcus sp. N016]WKA57084.1 EAL domain-containing protein [Planococcus sp. N016]
MKEEKGQIQAKMNTMDEFLVAIDENGTILSVNQVWIDFCMANEIEESLWKTGANYFEQLITCGKESELQAIKQVISQEIGEYTEMYPFLLKDNVVQWLEVKVRAVALAPGHKRGALLYHKPIGLHSDQLITAEIVLESMSEGFVLLNEQRKFTFLNEMAEKLLQCEREKVVGRGVLELFPEALESSFRYQYERALREQDVLEFIDYYQPLDTWLQIKIYPLKKGGLAIYLQDVSERKKIEGKLAESAYYDYLTGLPNRRLLFQTARSLIEQQKQFFVFHLNIDNLYFVNAVHHYKAGDTIMKKFAEELKRFSSETCQVGRLDGNEFIVLREVSQKEDVVDVAKQMEAIFQQPVVLENSQKIHVSVSIGIACFPFDAQTLDELFSCAEIAMYEAKHVPGSFHSFFHPMMRASYNRKLAIEEGLTGDLKANGFYYTLQPQIDGNSGELIGAEVLSRWAHPEFGEISPLEFIQAAEESSHIVPLTSHLLAEVFTQIKEWEVKFGWNLRTAINMTPSLLGNPVFFDDFFKLMEQHEIHPKLMEIEITEQAELTYSPQTLKNLLLCKSKGISIAIDDFGTGFSMISYLTHFPINKIKIDKSFVEKIGQDRKSEAVLKSLIHLAKSIECDLVAEGVERIEEAEFLQANDCSIFQGYLYDKPLTVKDFEAKYLPTRSDFTALQTVENPSSR